jgi:hypothetical protein
MLAAPAERLIEDTRTTPSGGQARLRRQAVEGPGRGAGYESHASTTLTTGCASPAPGVDFGGMPGSARPRLRAVHELSHWEAMAARFRPCGRRDATCCCTFTGHSSDLAHARIRGLADGHGARAILMAAMFEAHATW